MSDFKRGFEEEYKDVNFLPDPRKIMYQARDRSISQHSDNSRSAARKLGI